MNAQLVVGKANPISRQILAGSPCLRGLKKIGDVAKGKGLIIKV